MHKHERVTDGESDLFTNQLIANIEQYESRQEIDPVIYSINQILVYKLRQEIKSELFAAKQDTKGGRLLQVQNVGYPIRKESILRESVPIQLIIGSPRYF